MIEKNAARGNILWFRLVGKLTEEDYTNNLIPELERALEQYKKIRLLIQVEYFGLDTRWSMGRTEGMAAILKNRTHGYRRRRFMGRMDDMDSKNNRDFYRSFSQVL